MSEWIVYHASWSRTFEEGRFDNESDALAFETRITLECETGEIFWTEEEPDNA